MPTSVAPSKKSTLAIVPSASVALAARVMVAGAENWPFWAGAVSVAKGSAFVQVSAQGDPFRSSVVPGKCSATECVCVARFFRLLGVANEYPCTPLPMPAFLRSWRNWLAGTEVRSTPSE